MKAGCWLGKINGVQEQEIDPMIVSTNMLNMMKDDVGTIDVKGSRCTNVPMYLLRCFVENTLQGTMMKTLYLTVFFNLCCGTAIGGYLLEKLTLMGTYIEASCRRWYV